MKKPASHVAIRVSPETRRLVQRLRGVMMAKDGQTVTTDAAVASAAKAALAKHPQA